MIDNESAVQPLPNVTKIAVLRANGLGDYVFALPALRALRVAYPSAEIVLLGKPWQADFLTGRPGSVDRIEVVPEVAGFGGPEDLTVDAALRDVPEVAAFFARLRAERFDLALQLHGGGRHSNPVVNALGARFIVGLRDRNAPGLDRFLSYQYFQPEVFRYLEVVQLAGARPVTFEPRLELTDKDFDEPRRLFSDWDDRRRLVAIHPGATDPRRRWPPERFAAVADAFGAAGYRIVVTGRGAEADLVDQVCSAMSMPARPLVDVLSIGGLAALYASSALVLTNDTGPLHLASAVGARTVGLYWVGNLINGGPVYRERHRPVVSWTIHCPKCGNDVTRGGYRNRPGSSCDHQPSFLIDIPAAEVIDHAFALLGEESESSA